MLWDTHIHTSFSGDSTAAPAFMAEQAAALGLPGICITDHLDYDYPDEPGLFLLDIPAYARGIQDLQEQYQAKIPVLFGIELGLQPHLAQKHRELLAGYDFDYVIGSSHVMHGADPYYPSCYEGRTQEEAYREYFLSVLENIRAFDGFDAYGHLDYVVRYGPDKNVGYSYRKYQDVIDEILRALVEKGKGLEVNTAGFQYGLGHPNPAEDIIQRYRELGGEIVTVGSDAHCPEQLAREFGRIPKLLKSCGFRYYAVFRKRKPEFIRL